MCNSCIACYNAYMDMNIRNFPTPLLRELKTLAAQHGSSLRTTVIGTLESYLMERHPTASLNEYLDDAYPEERVALMAKLRVTQAAILSGRTPPVITPLTPKQREYMQAEEQEMVYERDEYSQA